MAQPGVDPLVFLDFQRELPVALLAVAYALVVLLVARWRGLAAMAGLGLAFVVLLGFTLPALLAGQHALGVALVTASLIMFATLYLAHGLSARTSTALLGTLVGLALTAGIAAWASGAAQITGTTDEASAFLPSSAPGADLRGIALCGIVLAGLGVLNDVTITQASAVWELRAVAPAASRAELFASAMRIGRDHIASTVYTIAFAYVGAALPLLMMVWLVDQSPVAALTSGRSPRRWCAPSWGRSGSCSPSRSPRPSRRSPCPVRYRVRGSRRTPTPGPIPSSSHRWHSRGRRRVPVAREENGMRAVVYDRFGGPEVLHLGQVPEPEAGPGRVRVRVEAVGLNPFDGTVRSGAMESAFRTRLPGVPGLEVAGVVDQVGDGVTGVAVGDRVMGWTSRGAAELAVLKRWARVPDGVDPAQAAALPVAGEAARRALRILAPRPAETLLVHGASGGVGGSRPSSPSRRACAWWARRRPPARTASRASGRRPRRTGRGWCGAFGRCWRSPARRPRSTRCSTPPARACCPTASSCAAAPTGC
nr:hypothetical protein GCM10025730_03140 [Promicromonospora thailandica]